MIACHVPVLSNEPAPLASCAALAFGIVPLALRATAMAKPIRSPKWIRQDLAQEEIANFLLPVGFAASLTRVETQIG